MTTVPIHTTAGCPYAWCRAHARTVTPAEHHAHQAVALARAQLDAVRRQRMRGECGNATVHQAEAELSAALDRSTSTTERDTRKCHGTSHTHRHGA